MSKDLLKKYASAIKSFEDRIKRINKGAKHIGHLINLKDFEDLKNKVDYTKNKNSIFGNIIIKDNEKKFEYNDIEIKSCRYLTNMLLNDNKYIIIDIPLYEIICGKGKRRSETLEYIYSNQSNCVYLCLTFKNGEGINFTNINMNNIIDKTKLKIKTSNSFEEIKKIYESIKKYYNFEMSLKNDLKSKKSLIKVVKDIWLIKNH